MKTAFLASCLLAALALPSVSLAATPDVTTLPSVEVRPQVGWVGHPHNERIVTLPTVTVRPDALTHLQAGALEAVALLPQVESLPLPALSLELPRWNAGLPTFSGSAL